MSFDLTFRPQHRPHTNNRFATTSRKANRPGPKPKFLQKKQKQDSNANDDNNETRADKVKLIAEWHTIEKRLASPALKDSKERQQLIERQQELGGLRAYQGASVHGGDKERGGETGKWCVKQLKELKVGLPTSTLGAAESSDKGKQKEIVEPIINEDGTKTWPKPAPRDKLRLLDVGGINGTSYSGYKWIDTTYIDLNAGTDNVIQCDFFDFPIPKEHKFDVVGLSLVVNFVGSLTKRAEMLCHAHKYLKPEGLLYLVLPLPCLTNSRYTSHERLNAILSSCGWQSVKQHDSAKLSFWLLKRIKSNGQTCKREQVRTGAQRNNFCIIVDEDCAKMAVELTQGLSDDVSETEAGDEQIVAEQDEEWGGIAE
ncbi:25S rRNA (adenine2142-N1)-methyltransferase [Microbotryomycetes sp. JL221]|nr:25S rRNA (adenine2142-N1)-methyltransferase [Microbotryomycetes sp. JL221]